MVKKKWKNIIVVFAVALCAALIVTPLFAQAVKKRASGLDDIAFSKAFTQVPSQVMPLEEVRPVAMVPASEAYDKFIYQQGGGQWTMLFDRVTGQPALIEGEGIPWIPGAGWHNSISGSDLGLPAGTSGKDVPLAVVATKAREFIKANPGLFGTTVDELTLNAGASGPMSDYLYFVDFNVIHEGVPVENAHVVFRINHGNLIQFGQEYISPALQKASGSTAEFTRKTVPLPRATNRCLTPTTAGRRPTNVHEFARPSAVCRRPCSFILHPSALIPHPSSLISHLSSSLCALCAFVVR